MGKLFCSFIITVRLHGEICANLDGDKKRKLYYVEMSKKLLIISNIRQINKFLNRIKMLMKEDEANRIKDLAEYFQKLLFILTVTNLIFF